MADTSQMKLNQFVLRRSNLSDIHALSELCQKTFRETYMEGFGIPYHENDVDAHFCSTASPESFAKKINDQQHAVWTIEDKTCGELVAFAAAGLCKYDDIPYPDVCSNQDGLINRCYIRRDRQGYGFGQQLMNAILPWLEEQYPTRPIWLSVFSKNYKAQKFYTHYGFHKVGEYSFPVGERTDHDFIMRRQANPI